MAVVRLASNATVDVSGGGGGGGGSGLGGNDNDEPVLPGGGGDNNDAATASRTDWAVGDSSLDERIASFVRAQPRPLEPPTRIDETFDPRIVSNPNSGNVFTCCGVHFRLIRSNVIGKAAMGTAINPYQMQRVLPGAIYDPENVRSVNSWGKSPRGLNMAYRRGMLTVVGADSFGGMLVRMYRMIQALQSQGYRAMLSNVYVFNMAATIRPISGLLPIDLKRFASRPVHAALCTYEPDSIDSVRYKMSPGISNKVTANIFSLGRVVLLGAHGPIVNVVVREIVSIIVTEFIQQQYENATGAHVPVVVSAALADTPDDELASIVLKANGIPLATDQQTDIAVGVGGGGGGKQTSQATGRRLTGHKRRASAAAGGHYDLVGDDNDDGDDDGVGGAGDDDDDDDDVCATMRLGARDGSDGDGDGDDSCCDDEHEHDDCGSDVDGE